MQCEKNRLSDDIYRFLILNQIYNSNYPSQRPDRVILFNNKYSKSTGRRKLPLSKQSLLLDENLRTELMECNDKDWHNILIQIVVTITEKDRSSESEISDLWKTILDEILPNIHTISHMILLCHFIELRDENPEEYSTIKDNNLLEILKYEKSLRQFISSR